MVSNEESRDQVWAAMPKSRLQKKGTVKPMEWVETINSKGKVCWVERPLKPSQAAQKRPHGTLRPSGTPKLSGTPRWSENDQAGGAIGSTGEELGGSHDHYIGHGAPRKTKVSTFGDLSQTRNANGMFGFFWGFC